ncbi:unnamed protein product [Rotaria sordida]|uniref:Xaa-Pro aminopeptidase n=1 Tax=Rotaria sordida TaxID=392033 RepID=A0A814HCX2_9BILA|nr:unnamed protein product [Rotaria sordida]
MSRVEALRALIKEHECDAYLITDSDGHYTFYSLSEEDRRLNWITECQAQCGLAIVTLNNKAFFQVPPNYRFLAKVEVNTDVWTLGDDIVQWINNQQLSLKRIAYDPRLTPLFIIEQFSALASSLYPIHSSNNWIDIISKKETSSEPSKLTPIWPLDEFRFAGQTSIEKDLQYEIRPYESFFAFLSTLKDQDVWLDERTSVIVLHHLSSTGVVRISRSPIQQMKEIKNSVELEGFRQCHFRDCAAVCQTFEWLQKSMENDALNVTELDVAKYLESRQREQVDFISIAFDTISASATNTALIEYSPFARKTKTLIARDLFYLDGGGNYLDGTTDMTRTLHFGQATQEQIQCYTLALKAILFIEMTGFPCDDTLTGCYIHSLLRAQFASINNSNEHISFGHGVSHGMGVVEGGIFISDSPSLATSTPIRPGMVIAIEPGIYFEGKWGIRLENVYEVIEDDQRFIHFIPLTLLPYSRPLIDVNLLSSEELKWINVYHQRCLQYVDGGTWMKQEIDLFL